MAYSAAEWLDSYQKRYQWAYAYASTFDRAITALNSAASDPNFSKWLGDLTTYNSKVSAEAVAKGPLGYKGLSENLRKDVARVLSYPWRAAWLAQKAREDKAAAYAGLTDRQRANLAAGRSADDLRPLPSESALAETQAQLAAAQARLRDAEANNLADRQDAANALAEAKRLAIEARQSADAAAQRQADDARRLAIEARQSADRAQSEWTLTRSGWRHNSDGWMTAGGISLERAKALYEKWRDKRPDGAVLVAGGSPPAPHRDAASDAASQKGPGDKSPGMPVWQKVGIAVLAAGGLYLATRKGKGKNYLSALKAPGALV